MSRNGPCGSSVPGVATWGPTLEKKSGHRGNSVQLNFALAQWPRPSDWRCVPTRLVAVAVAHRVRIRRGGDWRAGGGNAMRTLWLFLAGCHDPLPGLLALSLWRVIRRSSS
jgi:hypothetical protein